jgi:oxygen-independent coproporphyrinogen III oxidase
MSGIYIHIPFCKQACHYCNFHFSTSLRLKDEMIQAICKEIEIRHDYLLEKNLTSIYFGGGTPSLMDNDDIDKIFDTLSKYFHWSHETEITLEANPDDITIDKLKIISAAGINRLSIGIQSFFDEDLSWMHRAHNASEATQCIRLAKNHGYENISIDLIYGSPTTSDDMWEQNIDTALKMDIPHISTYCLTVEEKTALYHQVQKKKSLPPDQERAAYQFDAIRQSLTKSGYDHYEISNFAKPNKIAVHNTNYWRDKAYMGIGPSAHSYDGIHRSWNIANNKKYIDDINQNILPAVSEFLHPHTRYNEYIMTGLRTMWGVETTKIAIIGTHFEEYFLSLIKQEIDSDMVMCQQNNYILTERGKHFADRIAMNLFWVE